MFEVAVPVLINYGDDELDYLLRTVQLEKTEKNDGSNGHNDGSNGHTNTFLKFKNNVLWITDIACGILRIFCDCFGVREFVMSFQTVCSRPSGLPQM